MRQLFIFFLLCLLSTLNLSAQLWQADWTSEGPLSSLAWRYQHSHFVVQNNELKLSAPTESRQSFIATNTQLATDIIWQGCIRMDKLPNQSRATYILLACLEENRSAGWYDYLTLVFGGKASKGVALMRLRFRTDGESVRIDGRAQSEFYLLANTQPAGLLLGLNFRVRYRQSEGLSLYFAEDNRWQLINSREIQLTYNLNNSLGLFCTYPAGQGSGVSFSRLMILDGSSSETSEDHPIQSSPEREAFPWLSEVMANPEPSGSEYIELHNPSDSDLPLDGFQLVVGSTPESLRSYPLSSLGAISPNAYLVLTPKPESLLAHHPQADPSSVVSFPLPKLRNEGCHIRLYHGDVLCDSLYYTPQKLPRGLRSKRGISLERTAWEANTGQASLWQASSKAVGYATPTQAPSILSTSTSKASLSTSLSELAPRLREISPQNLSFSLLSFDGRTLFALEGEEARSWLLAFEASPRTQTAPLRQIYPLPLILWLRLADENFALKFFP